MTDPSRQRAARLALRQVASTGGDLRRLRAVEVVRCRRQGSKTPFYRVVVEDESGTQRSFMIDEASGRVVRED